MKQVGIIGGAGYTAGELIRILIRTLLSSIISITLIVIIQYLLFKEAKR